ncbi:MAG: transposase [Luteolibacter sp.]
MRTSKTLNPMEKAAKIQAVEAAMASGASLNKACADAGVSPASLLRWKASVAATGEDVFTALSHKKPTGRPPSVEFSESELAIARWCRLTKSSINIAVHFFCQDPDATPETIDALQRIYERSLERGKEPNWPMSVRRAFEVTAEEWGRFRGGKPPSPPAPKPAPTSKPITKSSDARRH